MAGKVFMQQVADAAGVHRTTVSLALRDHPRIPAGTRRRISEIAARLGYTMDPFVSALMHAKRTAQKTPRHASLGYITAYPTRDGWRRNPYVPDFLPGASARALRLGYKLEPFWAKEPGMTPDRLSDILHARGIRGVVLAPPPADVTRLELRWSQFSVMTIGVVLEQPQVHRIADNHFYTSRMALRKCVEMGFRRIGFSIRGVAHGYRSVNECWLGAYASAAYDFPEATLLPPHFRDEAGALGAADWVRKQRPEVVITSYPDDLRAELAAAGLRVPDDVGIVALNVRNRRAGFAGVYHDPVTTGAAAVDLLTALIYRNERGLPEEAHDVYIRGKWVDGVSIRR